MVKKIMRNTKSAFEDLRIWIESRKLRIKFSELAKSFPDFEQYRLSDQIIRASRSVTANIAEGYGRYHYQENIQFCRQARGSLYELIDQLSVALDENYVTEQIFSNIKDEIYTLIKQLNGYIKFLKERRNIK